MIFALMVLGFVFMLPFMIFFKTLKFVFKIILVIVGPVLLFVMCILFILGIVF